MFELPRDVQNFDLKKSSAAVGHLYQVLRASDGELLDGYHRLDQDPSWPVRILENVKTREQKLIVQAHANLSRRIVSRKERVQLVLSLAKLYEAQGLQVRKEFTYTRKDPHQGELQQTGHRNEIVDRLAEVLEGCLHKGTIQAYLRGSRFMQEKGPQPETKQRSSEDRELYRKKGALFCLRRFYSRDLRERFSRSFIKDLVSEISQDVREGLEREIRTEYREREAELRAELTDTRAQRLAMAMQKLRSDVDLRSEIRLDLMKELEVFEMNLRNVVTYHRRELKLIEEGRSYEVPLPVVKTLQKNGALMFNGTITPEASSLIT